MSEWAIRSQLLICPERSEQIAHSRSFDLSDEQMSNEQMSDERLSEFPTLAKGVSALYMDSAIYAARKLHLYTFLFDSFLIFKFFLYICSNITLY